MKNYIQISLTFLVITLTYSLVSSQDETRLDAGTMIYVQTLNSLNAENLSYYTTSNVSLVVAYNIVDRNGAILIESGTPINARVDAEKPRGVGKGARINIQYHSTFAVDGQTVPLVGEYDKVGLHKKGKAHGLTWGLFFTLLGPFSLPCLAIKGENVEISSGTNLGAATIGSTLFINTSIQPSTAPQNSNSFTSQSFDCANLDAHSSHNDVLNAFESDDFKIKDQFEIDYNWMKSAAYFSCDGNVGYLMLKTKDFSEAEEFIFRDVPQAMWNGFKNNRNPYTYFYKHIDKEFKKQ